MLKIKKTQVCSGKRIEDQRDGTGGVTKLHAVFSSDHDEVLLSRTNSGISDVFKGPRDLARVIAARLHAHTLQPAHSNTGVTLFKSLAGVRLTKTPPFQNRRDSSVINSWAALHTRPPSGAPTEHESQSSCAETWELTQG